MSRLLLALVTLSLVFWYAPTASASPIAEDMAAGRYGSAVFRWLSDQLAADDLRPVWGAADDNPAAGEMARKLGFEASARIAVLTPPLD